VPPLRLRGEVFRKAAALLLEKYLSVRGALTKFLLRGGEIAHSHKSCLRVPLSKGKRLFGDSNSEVLGKFFSPKKQLSGRGALPCRAPKLAPKPYKGERHPIFPKKKDTNDLVRRRESFQKTSLAEKGQSMSQGKIFFVQLLPGGNQERSGKKGSLLPSWRLTLRVSAGPL